MTPGTLHSDHVNYLILRYLQEHGHESAAHAFYNEWHRQPEYRDPENYTFAPVVRRGELVQVIQDALHFDELYTTRKGVERRYRFVGANARDRDGAGLPNGNAGSRPTSSAKRKGRVPAMRAPDEFPTPPPKRLRRSEGSEGVRLNGDRDAMEVDAASVSADAEEDAAASPTGPSEPEPDMVEVHERYDSVHSMRDALVQVDPVPKVTTTTTMYFKVDKPGAMILHSDWNPGTGSKFAGQLLVTGDSVCRVYQVPNDAETTGREATYYEPSLPSDSAITAAAWHPSGEIVTFALDVQQGPTETSHQEVTSHNLANGSPQQLFLDDVLEPPGIILTVQYSADGRYMLITRNNLQHSSVSVYDTTRLDAEALRPVASQTFERQIMDAVWVSHDKFLICGEAGLFEIWSVVVESAEQALEIQDPSHSSHRLVQVLADDNDANWDKINLDLHTGTFALRSSSHDTVLFGCTEELYLKDEVPGTYNASAVALHPSTPKEFRPRNGDLPLAAVASAEKHRCVIVGYNSDHFYRDMVYLENVSAHVLAWSHDGAYLAVGGASLVQIWKTNTLVKIVNTDFGRVWEAVNGPHEPLVTWRPDTVAIGSRDGENDEDQPLSEPSLKWSADGESLAYAVDNQIAVIRFQPPLRDEGRTVTQARDVDTD